MPTRIELVAVLPVEKSTDLFDLDLRVEVVLPRGCGEKMAGLMKRNGATLDGEDAYDALLERPKVVAVADCKKDASRVGARWAIRMRLPDGQTRDLTIGERVHKVARAGAAITVDGEAPQGDVPGAPPTAAPATFVTGRVASARATPAAQAIDLDLTAKWLKCVGKSVGVLGRGDTASKFALVHFEPVAIAPLDGSCTGAPRPRPAALRLPWHAGAYELTVGSVRLTGTIADAAAKK
jgi:hypothetical protein